MRFAICTTGLLLLIMMPLQARAIPAITCHCFTDRSFDPARPAAADPYFLATTQNSFFAELFNVDKKTLVVKKQQGAASDDLWIAYWVAARTGASPETLLKAKQEKETWHAALAASPLSGKAAGKRFVAGLDGKAPTPRLAEAVVDELFRRHQLLTDNELAALRQAGAANQELIIATVIAAKTRQPARKVFLEVKGRATTWGSLLQGAKIDPRNMQQEVADLLKLNRSSGVR